jgi:hypothetical protein
MGRKRKQNDLNEYKTTLLLLFILLAVMSLVAFIPLRHDKQADDAGIASYSK